MASYRHCEKCLRLVPVSAAGPRCPCGGGWTGKVLNDEVLDKMPMAEFVRELEDADDAVPDGRGDSWDWRDADLDFYLFNDAKQDGAK